MQKTIGQGVPQGRPRGSNLWALRFALLGPVILLGPAIASAPALAQKIEHPVAVFAALDKVTARISKLRVPLDETVQFGSLNVTPRVCYTRPPTEPPKTSAFVQVDDIERDGTKKRIFSGWMFAENPGLNSVEHPVFDVWLTGCADRVAEEPKEVASATEGGVRRRDEAIGMPLPVRRPYRRPVRTRRRTLR